jgi:hypothetical protein
MRVGTVKGKKRTDLTSSPLSPLQKNESKKTNSMYVEKEKG